MYWRSGSKNWAMDVISAYLVSVFLLKCKTMICRAFAMTIDDLRHKSRRYMDNGLE